MFPTSKSIPDTSTYLRKKQPLIADQQPPQAGQATAQEETGPQQPRQPQPPRLSPPQPSSETTSLQRPASAPQITPSAQQNDASQGPPPSLGDVQPFQRHTASDQQQNLPRLAGSRIPQTTIHYRLPDARTTQSSTARSPEVRQDAARGQISGPGSTTPATVQPPLRPPQTAQATYLRRLTELGQPLDALPRFLQPQPGPLSAATRPPYAIPTAAQARDQSTPQQPSSTAVGSPPPDTGTQSTPACLPWRLPPPCRIPCKNSRNWKGRQPSQKT